MSRHEDHYTNTVEDAAAHEHWRARSFDLHYDDRPTRQEIEAEERGSR